MESKFIRERISFLRTKKGVSEYKMSLDLGHSKGYIQSISSGKAFPSVPELLYICDYLGVTPAEFFDEERSEVQIVRKLYDICSDLCEDDVAALIGVAERIKAAKRQRT